MPKTPMLLALCAAFLLPGCDETDAAALRLSVDDDLSGTITASALELPATGGRAVEATQGAEWDARVGVVSNHGTFAELGRLVIADIVCTGGMDPSGMGRASLTLPRGETAQWPRVLVPMNAEERAKAAKAFDPSGKTAQVGATLKLEITLPANVLGNALSGKSRGVRVSAEGEVATLLVPIETALSAGDPLIWHLTWQRR